MVEYSATSETTTDPQVQAALNNTNGIASAKEAQIKALQTQIAELRQEHQFIQEAAAKFSIYMKNHSITHYNDATIEYMEQLIRDERSKLRAGETRNRLDRLERDKAQYETYVTTMEAGKVSIGSRHQASATDLDERGVALLVQQLYNLKHYGQMLKNISKVVGNAYAANFRERPHRIHGKRFWMESPRGGRGNHVEQGPVLWIPKKQNFRQSTTLDNGMDFDGGRDFDGPDTFNPGSGINRFRLTSNGDSRKLSYREPEPQEDDDLGWPSSHDYPSSQWSPSAAEEMPSPVRGIADWTDEDFRQQNGEAGSQGRRPKNENLASSAAARAVLVRSPPASTYSGPPPYTIENSYGPGSRAANGDGYVTRPMFGSAARKRSTWSKVKDKLRGL